jgi:hypothetical protein
MPSDDSGGNQRRQCLCQSRIRHAKALTIWHLLTFVYFNNLGGQAIPRFEYLGICNPDDYTQKVPTLSKPPVLRKAPALRHLSKRPHPKTFNRDYIQNQMHFKNMTHQHLEIQTMHRWLGETQAWPSHF